LIFQWDYLRPDDQASALRKEKQQIVRAAASR